MIRLVPIFIADGSWHTFFDNWRNQCEQLSEDIESFAPSSINDLRVLADSENKKAGVFSLFDGKNYLAVMQINSTYLPGYNGKVLRVRFLTLCPLIDYGFFPIDVYTFTLSDIFSEVIQLSYSEKFGSKHIKFHFRSPADREFFTNAKPELLKIPQFESVETKGAWLYISKCQGDYSPSEGEDE